MVIAGNVESMGQCMITENTVNWNGKLPLPGSLGILLIGIKQSFQPVGKNEPVFYQQ